MDTSLHYGTRSWARAPWEIFKLLVLRKAYCDESLMSIVDFTGRFGFVIVEETALICRVGETVDGGWVVVCRSAVRRLSIAGTIPQHCLARTSRTFPIVCHTH
ncbi:hypothetical protein J6590_050338 [Homalodisca vitripennis]|nr:hypothetical protein J6590_050338 [Homalodisca vitripennis]